MHFSFVKLRYGQIKVHLIFFATIEESIIERHISAVENYASLHTTDNELLVSRSIMLRCDPLIF